MTNEYQRERAQEEWLTMTCPECDGELRDCSTNEPDCRHCDGCGWCGDPDSALPCGCKRGSCDGFHDWDKVLKTGRIGTVPRSERKSVD